MLNFLEQKNLQHIQLTLEKTDSTDRSVFSDPVVISALVAGSVAVFTKIIDALVEVYKVKQEKKGKSVNPIIKIELKHAEPLELNLKHLPDDRSERLSLLENIPELEEEEISSIELLENG
jgi:hypothetical protein